MENIVYNMKALVIQNVSKEFGGVHAVENFSLEIEEGAITGIIGPNGSGKTTLTNVLTGITSLTHGTVQRGGQVWQHIHPWQTAEQGMTRTFQEVRLFGQMTVRENLLLALAKKNLIGALREFQDAKKNNRARLLLEAAGLWEQRSALANTLSYGNRKLLEIMRARAMDARIIFFDEPFAGLFPEMIKKICAMMKDLRAQGVTQVLVEHNMDVIRELADQVVVMDEGKLLAQGPAEEVLARRDVIEAYLGE